MDSGLLGGANYSPFLCGEESFGTGSDHIREKVPAVIQYVSPTVQIKVYKIKKKIRNLRRNGPSSMFHSNASKFFMYMFFS